MVWGDPIANITNPQSRLPKHIQNEPCLHQKVPPQIDLFVFICFFFVKNKHQLIILVMSSHLQQVHDEGEILNVLFVRYLFL